MSKPEDILWTPDGLVNLSAVTRDRVELRPALMRWFEQFGDFAQHFGIGIHCSRCKADLVARNGETDRVWSTACQCREFVGQNKDYKPVVN